MTRSFLSQIGVVAVALVITWLGWREFWFLTDDALIAFRYVSNSQLGFGYTWNPPPFRPVDGYTSWSWVALLDVVWSATGALPTEAANRLSLAFSLATVVLTFGLVRAVTAPAKGWLGLACLCLLGTVTNRTFLAWTSSGLETALFGTLVCWWVFEGVRFDRGARHAAIGWAAAAALAGLTRPDALPVVGCTAAGLAWSLRDRDRRRDGMRATAVLILPLAAYFVWHWARYGTLLPNTYYAKVSAPWPAAGMRYLASFILEYGLVVWLVVVGAAVGRRVGARRIPGIGVMAAIIALGYHVAYYTFVVGGDHFEYKAFAHLVPLIYATFSWAVLTMFSKPIRRVATFVGLLALGWVLPWTHYVHTRGLELRDDTALLRLRVAPLLPPVIRGYGMPFDKLQAWLISHFVGMRHQEHKVFYEFKRKLLPSREAGARLPAEGYPVHVSGEVGVPGWTLPHVAIIDGFGLNDYVIARSKRGGVHGRMGHDRIAPAGYVESFDPNVEFVGGKLRIRKRARPLTAERIREVEAEYARRVQRR